MTLREGSREVSDGACVGDVQRLAAKLRTRCLDRCQHLRDTLRIAAGQVDDIVFPELPGEAFHQREPEVACCAGHHCHATHDGMYIARASLSQGSLRRPRPPTLPAVPLLRGARLEVVSFLGLRLR